MDKQEEERILTLVDAMLEKKIGKIRSIEEQAKRDALKQKAITAFEEYRLKHGLR